VGKIKIIKSALEALTGALSKDDALALARKHSAPSVFEEFTTGFSSPRKAFYDPKYWEKYPDHLVDENGEIIATTDKIREILERGNIEKLVKPDPELMYRGMSADELADILMKGEVKSRGDMNFTGGQEGLTYFSSDPPVAESYANAFAPSRFKPDMQKPAYVISARRAPGERIVNVPGTGRDEIGVSGATPIDDIVGVYRGSTTAYYPGIETKGFSQNPSALLNWEEKSLEDIIKGYAGGGLVKLAQKAAGAVARTASPLRRATLNIGLDVPGGGRLAEEEVLGVLNRIGAKPVRVVKHQSDTEPTLVIELDRALKPDEADEVSRMLQQEAIAQVDEAGRGDLFGPMADKWKPFNGDYFIEGDGRRLTQAIMEAGDPNNVPGGATPDPVMEKLDEIAAGLKKEEPAFNKGGLVKKGVEAVAEALGSEAPMRIKLGKKKASPDWDAIMAEVDAGTSAHPFARNERVFDNRATFDVSPFGDNMHLGDIRSLQPNTGAGTAALEYLKGIADKYAVPITGIAKTYDKSDKYITDTDQLADWYRKRGFEIGDGYPEDGYEIIYNPRIKKAGGGLVKDGAKALMRLYHGRSYREPIRQLDPTISPDQLGIHLGDPETASKFATIRPEVRVKDAGARVIPLDVELQNPIRLMDDTGKWAPDNVYRQLVRQGKIEFDPETHKRLEMGGLGMVQDADGSWVDAGDGVAELDAMLEVQDIIRSLGHDGAVYLNRHELPTEAMERASKRDRYELRSMSDDDFRKEFPEAVDSYIAFRKEQLKSPFGDGPGVGFSEGGRVGLEAGGRAGVAYKIGKGLVDLLDFSGVAGKPKTVKIPERGEFAAAPISELDEAAEAYMKKHGIPGTHRLDSYPEFDEDFARRIADEYDRAQHLPNDPKIRRAYDALLDETMAQYRALENSGLDVRFLKDGMPDPYAKSPAMGYADIVDNGRLWVFPTEQGYGSDVAADVSNHPMLKKVGRVGDKEDAVANDAFRVVHDAYGHFGPGNPFFRRQGEDRAWMHHGRMFTDDALPAMSAETRGQNSWVNSGPHAAQNRSLSGGDTIYADQKATIMPPWVWEKDLGRTPKFADGGPVWSEEDRRSMTHDKSYGTGREMNYLETLGQKVPLGEMNYFDVDGERQKPEGIQALHDLGRMGIYGVPVVGPWIGAGLDTTEALATDDPLTAGMAVAFGPGGKKAKAALTGGLAYAMDPADAEAGMYGLLAKWAKSSEGQDALADATKMIREGAGQNEVRQYTGWFRDLDGNWKFELPSAGGSADLTRPGKGRLPDYYDDPHVFEQYPDLKDTILSRRNTEGASFYPDNDQIVVGDLSSPFFAKPEIGGLKGVLDHEVYHRKAHKEGWAQGSNLDTAKHQLTLDMKRFLDMKNDPYVQAVGQNLERYTPEQLNSLAFSRYEADIGEALASREAMRREYGPGQILYNRRPTEDIAMPRGALFYKDRPATPDQYGALVDWHNSKTRKE
jgi:hypothetical protein